MIYLDEWGTPRTDEEFYPENHPVGFTHPCPQCGGLRTFFSAGEQAWVCMTPGCGLIFDLSEVRTDWNYLDEDDYIGEVDEYTVTRRLE